ncbi:TetR family transcriptional regulator [Burkholderiaceae bacterium DAT-1]|nr:TetR family transcriptional regulator [Burkholderiaceae bacterium DAT-1]
MELGLEPKQTDTATRILDAAEALFVEHGFEATSMRMITQRAGVNLAAANYHFGSKDGLFQGVFTRRLAPLTELAVRNLDKQEKAVGGVALPANVILGALIDSALEIARDASRGGVIFVRLMSRTFVEPHPVLKETLPKHYAELVGRFTRAFSRALPHLTETELQWRIHFAFGAVFNAFAGNDILKLFVTDPVVHAREPERIAAFLVPFLVAGLNAPASAEV